MDQKEVNRLKRAADIVEIKKVQGRYMKCLRKGELLKIRDELMAIKHPEVSFELMESGEYRGPEHVYAFLTEEYEQLKAREENYSNGIMNVQNLMSPYIVLNEDATRARAQWTMINPGADYFEAYPDMTKKLQAYWFGGKFDNEFIKIDGDWYLLKVHVIAFFRAPYDEGWVKRSDCIRLPVHKGTPPDSKPRCYTYLPDRTYDPDSPYNWGPYID